MQACTGDWLFYVQSDEVVHERYLPVIRRRCEELLADREVEGLLFRYKHFWGDYRHYVLSHARYPHEVRIVRRDPEIHSWWTAQGFRRIPGFDGVSYRSREGTAKLRVAAVDAEIYHYGFVRPPRLMQRKNKAFRTIHWGAAQAEQEFQGPPRRLRLRQPRAGSRWTRSTPPAVMGERIARMDWQDQLRYAGRARAGHPPPPRATPSTGSSRSSSSTSSAAASSSATRTTSSSKDKLVTRCGHVALAGAPTSGSRPSSTPSSACTSPS